MNANHDKIIVALNAGKMASDIPEFDNACLPRWEMETKLYKGRWVCECSACRSSEPGGLPPAELPCTRPDEVVRVVPVTLDDMACSKHGKVTRTINGQCAYCYAEDAATTSAAAYAKDGKLPPVMNDSVPLMFQLAKMAGMTLMGIRRMVLVLDCDASPVLHVNSFLYDVPEHLVPTELIVEGKPGNGLNDTTDSSNKQFRTFALKLNWVDCWVCKDRNIIDCSVCDGVGQVKANKCGWCDGSGYVADGALGHGCSHCAGSGFIKQKQ